MTNKKRMSLAIAVALGLNGIPVTEVLALGDESDFDDDLLEEVIVTGTRLKTEDGFGRTSPVTVVGMDEIDSFGFTRVEDFLNTLPQVDVAENSFVSNGASGTATVDLRGLGAQRNLVLINGRRVQPGGVYSYAPDINQIPAQMIERVEVLTGGASATYGADAVAGVVNFIMRRVDGVEVSAEINGYQHDNNNKYMQGLLNQRGFDYPTGNSGVDGKAYNVSVVIGGDFADGRGNATLYANWRENEALLQGDRDYSSCALSQDATACGGSFIAPVPKFFIAPLTVDGLGPDGYDYDQERLLILNPDSSLGDIDPDDLSLRYNYAPINFYMRPDERWSLGAFVDYEINPRAIAYLEVMANSDSSHAQIAQTGIFWNFSPLSIDNAYFPENFRQSLEAFWPGAEDFGVYIAKRNIEGGARGDYLKHSSFRIVTGIKGAITDNWEYDVSYLHGQTASTTTYVNDWLINKISTAVDSRLCERDRDCIPYQVFTYQGVSEEAAKGLNGTGTGTAHTSIDDVQAYVTGTTPWGLPAGDISAAAGFEYRDVKFNRVMDTIAKQGQLSGWGQAIKDLDEGYTVNELFFEANVPLLANRAFARNMALDLAYRWSDYSTSGPNSTYRVGLDWQVLDWLRFRIGYNRAVRAPNIGELYTAQQLSGNASVMDPCEGPAPQYSLEQCARTGVTPAMYGNIDANPNDGVNTVEGGNPDLDPEAADTLTAGVIFEAGDAMQLSIDYWDISIKDAIGNMDAGIALAQCATNGLLCDLIQRGPGGSLWRGKEGFVYQISWNLGEFHWRGIDLAWNWTPHEQWQIGLIGTYYLKREQTVIAGDPETSFDCVGKVGGADDFWDFGFCNATPKWRHTASITFDSNSFWSVTGRWRYFGKVAYEGEDDTIAADNLGAQNYLDLSAVFRFMENHDIRLGVNNILDREPPLVGVSLSSTANTINGYDLLGRFLFANLTLRW